MTDHGGSVREVAVLAAKDALLRMNPHAAKRLVTAKAEAVVDAVLLVVGEHDGGVLEQRLGRLSRLCSLPDWDSYGAMPLTPAALAAAARICLVPRTDGGVNVADCDDVAWFVIGPDGKAYLDE